MFLDKNHIVVDLVEVHLPLLVHAGHHVRGLDLPCPPVQPVLHLLLALLTLAIQPINGEYCSSQPIRKEFLPVQHPLQHVHLVSHLHRVYVRGVLRGVHDLLEPGHEGSSDAVSYSFSLHRTELHQVSGELVVVRSEFVEVHHQRISAHDLSEHLLECLGNINTDIVVSLENIS